MKKKKYDPALPAPEYPELPALYLEYYRLMNAKDFYECHEVLEACWLVEPKASERRLFYQALIQGAVAIYHALRKNYSGARMLYPKTLEKLEYYRPHYMGFDTEDFIRQFKIFFSDILDREFPVPDLEKLPKIAFNPEFL